MFIVSKNNILCGIYDGEKKSLTLKKGEKIQDVPDYFTGTIGMDLRSFTEDWKLKPLEQHIQENLIRLKKDEKIQDNQIVKKSTEELQLEGLLPPDAGFKLKDGMLQLLTTDELLQEGKITIAEYNEAQKESRQSAYRSKADPLFFKYQRGEIDKQVWLDKCKEIKERFKYITASFEKIG